MKRLAALILVVFLTGCATLSKPEVFTFCKVADLVTTKQALARGGVEANPLMKALGYNGFAVLSLALIWYVWTLPDEKTEEEQAALTALSVVTCAAAHNNTGVMR